jgi:cell division protein FtsI (penicillin-binding protein 3)
MSAPRIVVAVMVDEPRSGGYYGGIVAAPAFSNIVAGTLRNMNVLPDAAIKQMVDQEFKSQNIKPAALTGGNNKVATTQ